MARRTPNRGRVAAFGSFVVFLAVFVLVGLLGARPAAAEAPAGDTESAVTSVEPPSSAFTIRILGGDESVRLDAQPGHEVVVLGYAGEPYLRVDPAGAVYENQRSPAVSANADRFDTATPSATADPSAPPVWQAVGSGGTFTWHDHRMHWMTEAVPPPGGPGDLVFAWTIPVTADGAPVSVDGELRQGGSTSPWPWVVVGVLVAAATLVVGRRARVATVAMAGVTVTVLAVAATVGERIALECWTCGPLVAIAPVAVAAVASVVVLVTRRDTVRVAGAAVALVALTGWLLVQAKVLWKPIVVSAFPDLLVRAGTAVALGLTVGGLVLAALFGRRALDDYASLPPAQRAARRRRATAPAPAPAPADPGS